MPDENNPLEALRSQDDKTDLQSALAEFVTLFANEDEKYRVTVLEVVKDSNGTPKTEYIKGWQSGEIPEYEDIARLGFGTYKVLLTYTPKDKSKATSTSVIVRISKKYVPPVDESVALVPQVVAQPMEGESTMALMMQMQQNAMNQQAIMMQQFFQVIGDVMVQREKRGNADHAGIQQMMGDIVMNNVEQQQQLVERILGSKYGVDFSQGQDKDEDPVTLFSFVRQLFTQYGDQLLNAGPVLQGLFKKQFQATDESALIEENPDLYIAAYNDIIKGDPNNKGKLDRILEILGAPNPDQLVPLSPDPDSERAAGS